MKISKLFHWLYAFLMALPIFAVGVTCAYVVFNKNAIQSYEQEVEFETPRSFTNYDYFEEDVIYTVTQVKRYYFLQVENLEQKVNNSYKYGYIAGATNFYTFYIEENANILEWSIQTGTNGSSTSITINGHQLNGYASAASGVRSYTENGVTTHVYFKGNTGTPTEIIQFNYVSNDLMGKGNNSIDKISWKDTPINDTFNGQLTAKIKNTKLSNVFYASINQIGMSPLFNWAYDSFLGIPITYVSGLFGLQSNHIVNLLLSYWLSISIIWLCFDLVMYVPNLVHKWIDKAGIE